MTGRYRVWPAAAVAGVALAAAAVVGVAGADQFRPGQCAVGTDWVAVGALAPSVVAEGVQVVDYRQEFRTLLRTCLDLSTVSPVDADPRS